MRDRLAKRSLFAALMSIGLVVAVASPAAAVPAVQSVNQPLVGTAAPISLFDTGLQVCDECVPDILVTNHDEAGAGAQLSADIETKWTSDSQTQVSYDTDNVRQGSTLPTSDAFTSSNGTITATFNLDGFLGLVVRDDPDPTWHETTTSVMPHLSHAVPIPCDLPPVGGPPRVCDSGPASFTIVSFPILPAIVDIDLNLTFDLQVTVDGNGVTSLRKATVVSGSDITPDQSITFSPTSDTQSDSMFVECSQPQGQDLDYSLTNPAFAGNVKYDVNIGLDLVVDLPFPFDDITVPIAGLGSISLGAAPVSLTGPDGTANLGPVLPDVDPPTADPGGGVTHTYPGVEGFAVSFDGSASSDPRCGPPALSWDFGDGSAAATGTSPTHAFDEEGTYHGTLTATNGAGLTNSTPFTVEVEDAPLVATGLTIVAPNPVAAKVATFIDTDPTDTPADPATDTSDYFATIAWGDGSSSAGTIVSNGVPHAFDVTGTHTYSAADLGPQTLNIHICDVGGACADAESHLTVFQFLDHGAFVVGDESATVGAPVTFWGAQWAKANSLSGGGASNSFKGFGETTSPAPAVCGGTFTGGPGNSASFGGQLPSFMGVIVSSTITKHGSSIGGNIVHIAVVQTNAGYQSNPGHAGTGTLVTVFC
jgi:PKD repeat protein